MLWSVAPASPRRVSPRHCFAASFFRHRDDVRANSYGLVSGHPFRRVAFAAQLLRRRDDVGAKSCGLVGGARFAASRFAASLIRRVVFSPP